VRGIIQFARERERERKKEREAVVKALLYI